MTGVPDGESGVLDVAALEALLVTTFHIGLDVGRGEDQAALVGLRLSKALLGAVEAQAWRRVNRPRIRRAHRADRADRRAGAARRRGQRYPRSGRAPQRPGDGRRHRIGRDRTRPTGRAHDGILDAALRAAAGLVTLLGAAAEAVTGLLELGRLTAASGPTGNHNLT